MLERKLDDHGANIVGDAIPVPARPRRSILQRLGAAGVILVVPAVENGAGRTDLFHGAPGREARRSTILMISILADGGYHFRRFPPSANMLFGQTQPKRLLSNRLLQRAEFAPKILDLIGGRGTRDVARQTALASLEELLQPDITRWSLDPDMMLDFT